MPAPPPVPALPDQTRAIVYMISAQTGPFAVNNNLYGDSTDYGAWIEVYLNSILLTAGLDYTLSSPTGPIGSIPLPITDATITLTVPSTGRLVILGARRPRRPNQFMENRGVPARDLNEALTDILATQREIWDLTRDSLISVPRAEQIAPLPPASSRAGLALAFDSGGNPVLISPAGTTVTQFNNGTVSSGTATINVASPKQRLTVGGAITIAFTGWPIAGIYTECEIELINGGLGVTWPTVSWLRGDGSNSTTFGSMGVTLLNPGTNWIIVWSRDAGATVWGRAA